MKSSLCEVDSLRIRTLVSSLGIVVRGIVVGVLLLSCAGGEPKVEPTPRPIARPLPLGDDDSHLLIFRKVMFRIVNGTVLGKVRVRNRVVDEMRWSRAHSDSAEFNVAITNALRDLGYQARDAADALFDPSSQVKIRYGMAAILHAAKLDFDYKLDRRRGRPGEGVGTADVEVEVLLHDSIENRIVYSRTFSGHGTDTGLKPNPIVSAVVDGVLKSATDPEFVKIVSMRDFNESASVEAAENIDMAACPDPVVAELPEGLPDLLEALVEIQVGASRGTGVVISPDGWILTAAHVVDDSSEVWVRLSSGPQVPAKVHRLDARLDIALLRVPGRDYRCAQLRESDGDLALGSDVFMVNMGLGEARSQTISRGVVSGYLEFDGRRHVQTDASVNPGSSGGPMLSNAAAVTGITVSKVAAPGFEGIAFAVPIQTVVTQIGIQLR